MLSLRHPCQQVLLCMVLASPAFTVPALAADKPAAAPKAEAKKVVWTDAADPSIPADFAYQGEYAGELAGAKIGAQAIALAGGEFQVVVLPGGLPGAGWDGKNKSLLAGKLEGDAVALAPAEGNRKYLSQKPSDFSATKLFPPVGQTAYTGSIVKTGLTLKSPDGKSATLARVVRQGPTLGAQPAAGAVVLFDGSNKTEWKGGRLDEKTKLLNTDGQDISTTRKFKNYHAHVEFMLPYRPEGRGQGRGNSGFYQVDLYEVQILDSFGLEGENNECGGVYTKAKPLTNACLPPLQWQTYDVDFTSAIVDEKGAVVQPAKLTAKLNGILIHDNLAIIGKTGGSRSEAEGTPGILKLQGHGNPLQFRNIWIVEK